MKYFYLSLISVIILASCSKRAYGPDESDGYRWTRTHEQAFVSYVDPYSGNYIMETPQGYTVVATGGYVPPRENDEMYAYFGVYGRQTIYNYTGNFFTAGTIVEYGLSWDESLYVLDHLSANHY